MTPEPRSSVDSSNARSRRTAENKFTSKTPCQSSSLTANTPSDGADERLPGELRDALGRADVGLDKQVRHLLVGG